MPKRFVLIASMLGASAQVSSAPYLLVPEDSQISLTVKEMGVSVAGKFGRFEAAMDIDPAKPERSSADLRIDVGSLDTGNVEADAIAIDPDWLDQAHAPYATFKSASIRSLGGGIYEAKGRLGIRNQERDIVVQFSNTAQPGGKSVIDCEFVIKRSEFGIGGGVWNEEGVVAEEVPVKVRLTLAPAANNRQPSASR